MAIAATALWEVESGGSDSNGGGFDPGQTAGMLTDGAATSATSSSPVFTSGSYNFVAGDVGAWIFIASGTNWTPGWYKIASVASNAATLSAAIGAAVLYNVSLATITTASTAAGCATTASPTAATWSIDYSQQSSAAISFTDLVIAATTTNATSVANPLGKQMVGNVFNVTSGTGFTVQRVCLQSVSTVTGTFDKSLGSAASTGGHAAMGGALADIDKGNSVMQTANTGAAGQRTYVQAATYTTTVGLGNNNGVSTYFVGYTTVRADNGQATYTTSTNSKTLLSNQFSGLTQLQQWYNFIFTNTASVRAPCFANATGGGSQQLLLFQNCTFSGFTYAVDVGSSGQDINTIVLRNCKISSCTTSAIYWAPYSGTANGLAQGGPEITLEGCLIQTSTSHGMEIVAGNSIGFLTLINTVFYDHGGHGIYVHLDGQFVLKMVNSVSCANTTDGVHFGSSGGAIANDLFTAFNSIFTQNGGYGVSFRALPIYLGAANAYYGNTSGPLNNALMLASDVTLTGDPFTNKSGGDFSLNGTAGAGAACAGAGWPTAIPG